MLTAGPLANNPSYAPSKEMKRRTHRQIGSGRLEMLVYIFRHLYNMPLGFHSAKESHFTGSWTKIGPNVIDVARERVGA